MRLHPEHGVNPTLGLCFWCGEPNGEVLLVGAAVSGKAPLRAVGSYDPCSGCKTQMEKGITLLEVVNDLPQASGQPCIKEISGGAKLYPTGRWVVATPDAVRDVFNDPEPIIRSKRACVDSAAWELIMPDGGEDGEAKTDAEGDLRGEAEDQHAVLNGG